MSAKEGKYINGYHESVMKSHGWRTADNSCQFLLPTLKKMVEANPTLTLLDVGSGAGTITASLAKLLPKGHVTATDISTSALGPAREHAESVGVQNMSFGTADVYALPYADHSFDIVHAQQLLGHLSDPVSAIKEMFRVTKPGGVVALREGDIPSVACAPLTPLLDRWHKILLRQLEEGPGCATAGRQLKGWCLQAGIEEGRLTCSAGTWCHGSREEREAWAVPWMGRVTQSDYATKAVEGGMATKEELEEIRRAWEEWIECDEGWLAIMHGQVLIKV